MVCMLFHQSYYTKCYLELKCCRAKMCFKRKERVTTKSKYVVMAWRKQFLGGKGHAGNWTQGPELATQALAAELNPPKGSWGSEPGATEPREISGEKVPRLGTWGQVRPHPPTCRALSRAALTRVGKGESSQD